LKGSIQRADKNKKASVPIDAFLSEQIIQQRAIEQITL
jgi:hypothetical protein